MISRRADRAIWFISALLLVALGVLLFFQSFQKQHWDSDVFWALASGEWIVTNFAVPRIDPFSYTFGGKPWIDFTWGFQVIVHLFYTYLGGWTGLFILQLLTTFGLFLVVGLNLKRLAGGRFWLVSSILVILFACAYPRLFIRPHLPAYLLIAVYLMLFTLYEDTGRSRYLWMIPVLQVLWTNLHSSSILGFFIAGAYAAGAVIDEFRSSGFSLKLDLSARVKRYLALSAIVPVASLLNPYGLKLVLFPFVHQSADNADALRHIGEWQSIPIKDLVFILTPTPVNHFAFEILLLGSVAALLINIRSIKSRDVILLAGAFYMASSHIRWMALFGFFAAPILAANVAALLGRREGTGSGERGGSVFKWTCTLLGVFVASLTAVKFFSYEARVHYGVGIQRGGYPEVTVKFMKDEGIRGNIFNEYVFGGYLIHAYPEAKPFIDPRTPTVYSPYFFWASRLVDNQEMWERLVSEHVIDMALIKPETRHCVNLWESEEWRPVMFDDKSVLFLKNVERFREIISKYGMVSVDPCTNTPKYELPEEPEKLLSMREELKELSTGRAKGAARPLRLLGLVLTRLGSNAGGAGVEEGKIYLEEAVNALTLSVGIKKTSSTLYDLGVALGKLGRSRDALDVFEEAVLMDRSNKEAYLAAGIAYFDLKEYGVAVKYLKKYAYLADDASGHMGYRTLGFACFEQGDLGCAEVFLKRAAFNFDDEGGLHKINYYLGNVYLETRDFTAAEAYYRKAISGKPEYVSVLKDLAHSLERKGDKEKAGFILSFIKEAG